MRKRILLVDDEQLVLRALQRVLRIQAPQWEVHVAGGVDEAWTTLLQIDFDAIVSDVNMPGKSGFDLLELIRESPRVRDVPVVILTANAETALKRRALDEGATDLLNKPVESADLVARIRSVLRIKEYQDAMRAQNDLLELRVRERTAQLERERIELIWRLGRAGEYRDNETGHHVIRVGYYTQRLAEVLGVSNAFQERVFLTSPLHDIGKIGIPDSILKKPGHLDPAEWVVMRLHTRIGAEILGEQLGTSTERNPFIEMAQEIALAHHERWDGTGYPMGLHGSDIPLAARLTTLADVFDALSSRRVYKPAMDFDDVYRALRRGKGTQFDPDVVEAFDQSIDEFQAIREDFVDPDDGRDITDVLRERFEAFGAYDSEQGAHGSEK